MKKSKICPKCKGKGKFTISIIPTGLSKYSYFRSTTDASTSSNFVYDCPLCDGQGYIGVIKYMKKIRKDK